jgi:hypothetical protein
VAAEVPVEPAYVGFTAADPDRLVPTEGLSAHERLRRRRIAISA